MVNYILSKMIINNIIDENELDNYHYALGCCKCWIKGV